MSKSEVLLNGQQVEHILKTQNRSSILQLDSDHQICFVVRIMENFSLGNKNKKFFLQGL
jgi:hypothetical protein